MLISTGELLYALGVVREAQKNYKESFNYFKRALAQFKKTDMSGPSKAKTHYKIALHYIHSVERNLAELRLALKDEELDLTELKLTKLKLAKLGLAELNLAERTFEEVSLAEYAPPTSDNSAQIRKH